MKPPTDLKICDSTTSSGISRREFLQNCGRGSIAFALSPVLNRNLAFKKYWPQSGPAVRVMPFDHDWLFGGKFLASATSPDFDDAAFARVSLPHCVAKLSWQSWNPASWEDTWIYRRHFSLPKEFAGLRVFLHFDGVMVGAAPTVNGHPLPKHLGGYLPFQYEITDWVKNDANVLALAVDSRWSNVPPEGSPKGPGKIDYLEPGGIYRSARLKAVPHIFIRDVFAKPVQVLDPSRRVDVLCTLDADMLPNAPVEIQIELKRGERSIARSRQAVPLDRTGPTEVKLSLSNLGNIELWDVDAPNLYTLAATLLVDAKPLHEYRVRLGFRDARFELNGFFLNGRRLQLFGLNRHQYYPYVGGAMPPRVQRRDAEILRRDFNCNMVRCSHYPQSEAFLDACDELGLMVWEEVPGWQYLGDASWQDMVVRDTGDMIVRDRNRPSIVIWGVRVNESANDVPLYRRTTELAKSLDDSRPASGTMTPDSRKNWKEDWHEDVFAFDDYHSAPDGTVGIEEPVEGFPYLITEAVGQFSYQAHRGFNDIYRRAGDAAIQQRQAIWHAQAHSRAAANPKICGVLAWCGFEYPSLMNAYHNIKYPGVADIFRIPKLGASFYLAQKDPQQHPVIEPNFYWDFGPQTPRGPGKNAAIFSNCDRLELFVDGKPHSTLHPDVKNYPNLKHAPCFADLELADLKLDGTDRPELRIDGYLGSHLAYSRSFSSDPRHDRLLIQADDPELIGDGVDATRLICKVVDRFGANRAFAGGEVRFEIAGPGFVVGDNPFFLEDAGGAGAVWIKTLPRGRGTIRVTAKHSSLGQAVAEIKVIGLALRDTIPAQY